MVVGKLMDKNKGSQFYMVPHLFFSGGYSNYVKPTGIAVLNCLYYHRNHKSKLCYPSDLKISHEIGCTRNTLYKYIKLLCDCEIIKITKQQKPNGGYKKFYRVNDTSKWILPNKESYKETNNKTLPNISALHCSKIVKNDALNLCKNKRKITKKNINKGNYKKEIHELAKIALIGKSFGE